MLFSKLLALFPVPKYCEQNFKVLLQRDPKDVRALHNAYHLGWWQYAYRQIELFLFLGAQTNCCMAHLLHHLLGVCFSAAIIYIRNACVVCRTETLEGCSPSTSPCSFMLLCISASVSLFTSPQNRGGLKMTYHCKRLSQLVQYVS